MDYISQTIGDEYQGWSPGNCIVIDAQTGTGKTQFILKTLLPYAHSQQASILYLCNRSALGVQIEAALNELPEYVNNITVMTYQKFIEISYFLSLHSEQCIDPRSTIVENAQYWVMDEAHYFLSDSSFNGTTSAAAQQIARQMISHINIFMTATTPHLFLTLHQLLGPRPTSCPEIPFLSSAGDVNYAEMRSSSISCPTLLHDKEQPDSPRIRVYSLEKKLNGPYIDRNESPPMESERRSLELEYRRLKSTTENYFQERFRSYQFPFDAAMENAIYYHTQRDFSYIRPFYFRTYSELVAQINASPVDEKWLIFVSSLKDGRQLEVELKDAQIQNCVFVCAESKKVSKQADHKALKKITDTETFNQRVLIATAVIDNGVNINDPCLKHIIITAKDPTTFLQMLGRKRLAEGDSLNVYLKSESIGNLKKYVHQRILNPLKFVFEFQHQKQIDLSFSHSKHVASAFESDLFWAKYAKPGSYDRPYANFIQRAKAPRSPSYTLKPEEIDRFRVIDAFELNPLAKTKLTFDYYRWMALFEQYENLSQEEKVHQEDTFWLQEQLSWIGMQYDEQNWLSYASGRYHRLKVRFEEMLSLFLDGIMREEQEMAFKSLLLDFSNAHNPPLLPPTSKASLSTVNKVLAQLGYQYKVISIKKSINGTQRNWWSIKEAPLDV